MFRNALSNLRSAAFDKENGENIRALEDYIALYYDDCAPLAPVRRNPLNDKKKAIARRALNGNKEKKVRAAARNMFNDANPTKSYDTTDYSYSVSLDLEEDIQEDRGYNYEDSVFHYNRLYINRKMWFMEPFAPDANPWDVEEMLAWYNSRTAFELERLIAYIGNYDYDDSNNYDFFLPLSPIRAIGVSYTVEEFYNEELERDNELLMDVYAECVNLCVRA
jgi:hypothetical protein